MKRILLLVLVTLLLSSCRLNVNVNFDSPVDPNVFYLDELPDIGSFSVQSDENAPSDFVPSDDYGMILPFIGSYRIFETPSSEGDDWKVEMGYGSYGFCTPDGKVIMKASDKNSYLNFRFTEDGFGYYTLNRESIPKNDAPDEFTPDETYIIPLDGSWCICLDAGSWVNSVGGGYISIIDYPDEADGLPCILVYDYDGKFVRRVDGVDSTGIFSQGLMMVSNWTNDGYSARFVNEEGETVLGPFTSAVDFNQKGISAVADENGAYLINTKGERLTDYYESFFREYSNDMTRHVFSGRYKNEKDKCDIFSEDLDFLGTVEGSSYASFRFPDNGRILYYYTTYNYNDKGYPDYNTERMVWKYLDTGEEFSVDGRVPNSYSGTDNCFIHIDKNTATAYIYDGNGNLISEIPDTNDIINTSEYGEFVITIEGEYDYNIDPETGMPYPDMRKTHIVDTKTGKKLYTVGAGSNAHFVDSNKRYVRISVYDTNDFFGGVETCWLFDTKKGEVVLYECDEISYFDLGDDIYFAVAKGNMTALYDGEMNVVRKAYFE